MSAFIELHEDTYVRSIWNALFETFDVMGWMYRHPGQPWAIGYRFRFYVDNKPFNSEDRKEGWTIKPRSVEPDEAELAQIAGGLDTVFALLAERERARGNPGTVHRLDCNCTGAAAGALIQQAPWNHTYSTGQTTRPGQRPGGKA